MFIGVYDTRLQDVLRLLHLWFKFGHIREVKRALQNAFDEISVRTWLDVIPQIVARLHTGRPKVRQLIFHLLKKIGKEHPQALVHPLTVASKSRSEIREKAAQAILNEIKQHSELLVKQANMVGDELIRIAILWHEMWFEGLVEASKLFWVENKADESIERLKDLYDSTVNKGKYSYFLYFLFFVF